MTNSRTPQNNEFYFSKLREKLRYNLTRVKEEEKNDNIVYYDKSKEQKYDKRQTVNDELRRKSEIGRVYHQSVNINRFEKPKSNSVFQMMSDGLKKFGISGLFQSSQETVGEDEEESMYSNNFQNEKIDMINLEFSRKQQLTESDESDRSKEDDGLVTHQIK